MGFRNFLGMVSLKVSDFFEGNYTSKTSRKFYDPQLHSLWDFEIYSMVSLLVSDFFERNSAEHILTNFSCHQTSPCMSLKIVLDGLTFSVRLF